MKRLTHEFVKNQFDSENYKLLSKEYVNAHQKLEYICPEGHVGTITYGNWYVGKRCYICGIQSRAFKRKHSTGFISKQFKKEGYILLTKKYINNLQKLDFICSQGHKHYITWADWISGHRCTVCGGSMKLTHLSIKSQFEKEGYELLSKEYINAHQKLDYICPVGHYGSMSWNNWKAGHRCSVCATVNKTGSNHWNWRGGISCEPYCDIWLDKKFKESVKARDNYKCQNPDCWGISDKLVIHHIDYNKKNCSPDNLITLCNSCNSRANKDRDLHKQLYKKQVKLLME